MSNLWLHCLWIKVAPEGSISIPYHHGGVGALLLIRRSERANSARKHQ